MSIHTRYTRLAIGVLAIASILLSAPAASEERLVIADGRGDWGGLAPYLHIPRGPGYVYTSFVFDTLLWKDETGKLSPALAQAWHHDDSGLCYRFTIREDATWHDGRVLGVDDVVFTIAYMQQHPYRFVDLSPIESARRLSERDAEICMHKPYAPFLTTIAASLPILPKHIYHKVEQPDRFRTSEAMIGSGPYRVDTYNRAQGRYRLLRNDNYYGGTARYKAIHIAKMQPDAALVALQKGEVDVMAVSHDRVPQFTEAGVALQRQLSNHPYRLVFNHGGSFRETALRQALAYAIDRQALLDVVYPDRAIVAAVGYFQGDAATPDLAPYAFAPKKAAALLQAQGWERQTSGRWHTEDTPVTLTLIASPKARLLAEAVAAQLHSFGIEITLRLEQGPQLSQRLKKHNFDLALLSTSHQGDPDRFRRMLTGSYVRGDRYRSNPQLNTLLSEQQHQLDGPQRRQQLIEAEHLYNADLPSYPLINPVNVIAYNPDTIEPHFTPGGIAMGIPLALNKTLLID